MKSCDTVRTLTRSHTCLGSTHSLSLSLSLTPSLSLSLSLPLSVSLSQLSLDFGKDLETAIIMEYTKEVYIILLWLVKIGLYEATSTHTRIHNKSTSPYTTIHQRCQLVNHTPLCHYPNQISLKTKATKTSQLSLSNLATNILPFPHAGKTLQIALAVHVHVGYMYM
jgi:hypothetical protein